MILPQTLIFLFGKVLHSADDSRPAKNIVNLDTCSSDQREGRKRAASPFIMFCTVLTD